MKQPQCTTAAQCYRELARVMELTGCKSSVAVLDSGYIKWVPGVWGNSELAPAFVRPEDWEFAIAILEGKPVFIGDEVFDVLGNTVTVNQYHFDMPAVNWEKLSWNPPKPKTALIELPLEMVEIVGDPRCLITSSDLDTIINACKAFLGKQKGL